MTTCKERMKLIRTAIDECRVNFIEIRNKYLPDDGDGLHGAAKKEQRRMTEKYRAYEKFYNAVVNAEA